MSVKKHETEKETKKLDLCIIQLNKEITETVLICRKNKNRKQKTMQPNVSGVELSKNKKLSNRKLTNLMI